MKPTIGRQVHFHCQFGQEFYQDDHSTFKFIGAGPFAATICHVHSDELVNLAVFDGNGHLRRITSVKLATEENAEQAKGGMYCCWPPRV